MQIGENKTVLLADDDIDYLNQMKLQLETIGFNVVTAESQKEAEEKLTQIKPDLVISDLMMERFDDGFGLSKSVKQKFPGTPVIMVTSVTSALGLKFNTMNEDEKSWIKADVLLNKPIRFEQLVKEINKLLK